MGLDIRVYKNMTKVTDPAVLEKIQSCEEGPREGAYELGLVVPYINPHFESRAEGIEPGVPYNVSSEWGFRAGSYSGYGAWREQLAELVGITNLQGFWGRCEVMEEQGVEPDVPFWQLLHFSDCEGTLGPVVSKKLAKDFADWEERAEKFAREMHEASNIYAAGSYPFEDAVKHLGGSEGAYFWRKYQEWQRAFADAVEGCVVFH